MPREYRHMKQYEKEILELKAKGLTQRKRQINLYIKNAVSENIF